MQYLCLSGAVGYDFTSSIDDTEKAVHSVAKTILRHGVTAFCPTIVSSLPTVYRKVRKTCYYHVHVVIILFSTSNLIPEAMS